MKPLYVLSIDASAIVPIGGLRMEVSNPHTFHFEELEERTEVMDWAKAQGWKVTTDVLFTTNGLSAMRHVRKAVREACEYFHLPVPDMPEPTSEDPSQGA